LALVEALHLCIPWPVGHEDDSRIRATGFTATAPDKPVVPHVDVHVSVAPAEVTILPIEPKTREIARASGEIIKVVEEP